MAIGPAHAWPLCTFWFVDWAVSQKRKKGASAFDVQKPVPADAACLRTLQLHE